MESIKERKFNMFVVPIIVAVSALVLNLFIVLFSPAAGIIASIVLGAVVVGALLFRLVYGCYFMYRLSLDVNAVCKGDGAESESYAIAFVLNFLTFGIYELYWIYKLGTRLKVNAPRYGYKMYETGKDFVILDVVCFGLIGKYELIKNMNRIGYVYNQKGLPETVGGVQ